MWHPSLAIALARVLLSRDMTTLAEIERAADSLSADELRALLGHVEARLKGADVERRSEAAQQLTQTLRALSRPMGGKTWSNRDELHER
jgi:hypothetical protein